MKHKKYFILSAVFTAAVGTFLHFLFELSGENPIFAVFSAVNESVFEHLKLLFWPFLITTVVGLFVLDRPSHILLPAAVSVTTGMFFIAAVHFTYTAFIGKSIPFIDISLFFLAVILSYSICYLFYRGHLGRAKMGKTVGILIFALLIFCFVRFTFSPPETEAFLDPVSKTYGI